MPELPLQTSDTAAVLAAGMAVAGSEEIGPGLRAFVVPDGYEIVVHDANDEIGDGPRRKTGAYEVHNPESFVAYLERHGTPWTEVFANERTYQVEAVIDGHGATSDVDVEGQPGWQEHTVGYAPRPTPEWQAWAAGDGNLGSQERFAEHIEDRAVDIVDPSGADMLELAQNFHATKDSSFKSSRVLSSGERQFEYREELQASAGRAGRLEIPKEFTLALRPFEGSDAFKVTARLRYRIQDERLLIGWKLVRPEDITREAFASVVAHIGDNVDAPVFAGARR